MAIERHLRSTDCHGRIVEHGREGNLPYRHNKSAEVARFSGFSRPLPPGLSVLRVAAVTDDKVTKPEKHTVHTTPVSIVPRRRRNGNEETTIRRVYPGRCCPRTRPKSLGLVPCGSSDKTVKLESFQFVNNYELQPAGDETGPCQRKLTHGLYCSIL